MYKANKNKGYLQEIFGSIKANFVDIGVQFLGLKQRKKYLVIGIFVYVLVKVVMVFPINIHTPTFDEDAVAGWDMKTKIFASTQSLVLDTTSPEYFGTDYGRYPFAGIVDTYFLLPYGDFVNGLGNIISPLIYLLALLLLFGIFLRKTHLFVVALSGYVFVSLPFLFIHGFGSYWNLPSGVFLFVFIFYLVDQLLHIEKEHIENKQIIFPLILVGFLSSVTRNEGVMLTGIIFFAVLILYHIFKKNRANELKYQLRPLLPVILGYVLNKIIFSFYPAGTVLNTGGAINADVFNSLFVNLNQPGVFVAPFQQMFYHSDYGLLFILFVISLIIFVYKYKKMKSLWLMMGATILLILVFMFVLYANVQSLGLLSHFAFIRYPVSIVLFLIYTIIYSIYLGKKSHGSEL